MLSAPRTRTPWNGPSWRPAALLSCLSSCSPPLAWACCWSQVLAPGGWTLPKLVMLAAFLGTAPWTGLCLANGLIGFVILVVLPRSGAGGVSDRRRQRIAAAPLPRTAIAVTVRNEDMRLVAAAVAASAERSGRGRRRGCVRRVHPVRHAGPARGGGRGASRWRRSATRIAIRGASATAGAPPTPASRPAMSWISSTATPPASN